MSSPYMGTYRAYRQTVSPGSTEVSFQVVVEETDLQIVAETDFSNEAITYITELRGVLKAYIALHPEFGTSLVPIDVQDSAHPIIQEMAQAARICGVGPMATVAGGTAQYVATHFASSSPNTLVENGGDLYLCSTKQRVVAILADPTGDASIGISISEQGFPVSICASSATIGHSLSLGQGDLVVTRSPNAFLADAAATRLCNELKAASDLERITEMADVFGLDGLFAQCGGQITAWGNMELVAV